MKKISQSTIVKKSGIPQSTISNILCGRKRPSWKLAKCLSKATMTDPVIWMEGTPEEIKSAIEQGSYQDEEYL